MKKIVFNFKSHSLFEIYKLIDHPAIFGISKKEFEGSNCNCLIRASCFCLQVISNTLDDSSDASDWLERDTPLDAPVPSNLLRQT